MDTATPPALADDIRFELTPAAWTQLNTELLHAAGLPATVFYYSNARGLAGGPFRTVAGATEWAGYDGDLLDLGRMSTLAWLHIHDVEPGGHYPDFLYNREDVDHLASPAELCGRCSDYATGHLVPVSFCPPAAAMANLRDSLREIW